MNWINGSGFVFELVLRGLECSSVSSVEIIAETMD